MSADAVRLGSVRRWFGRVRALDGLSLCAKQGEVYGLLGRNGAGKTTALRVLMGIVRASDGQIEVLGKRVKRVTLELKRQIGYVSQDQHFYPWMNARELGRFVSAFYPRWDPGEYVRLLARLDVPLERRAAELSGGTRAKLGLALALAPRPALLLLDEPTTGLDPVARRECNDLLTAMVRERGIAALLSSHLVDEVQDIATRVGIVQAGRMSIEGPVPELQRSVRRLELPDASPLALPLPGFTRVRDDVFHASASLWEQIAWPEGTAISSLSLEDIFLAFARSNVQIAPEVAPA
jgi:ABC-2 type transport system ATP-binding protein